MRTNISRQLYGIFWILLFLQNFAVITTAEFGISAVVFFLVLIFFYYRGFKTISKNLIWFICVLLGVSILSACFNTFFSWSQFVRLLMIVFTAWASYKFTIVVLKDNQVGKEKIALYIIILFMLYGIYQFVAVSHGWPHFLNIFSNNTSYTPRDIYGYFGGWTGTKSRVYGVFSEPSFYATFLCLCFVLLQIVDEKNKKLNRMAKVLIILNLYLTGSRSGWMIFAYLLLVIVLMKLNEHNYLADKFVMIGAFFVPFIIVLIMNWLIEAGIYNDASAFSRTYSSLYYLSHSFDSLKDILLGHSLGYSWSLNWDKNGYIESVAHNGYIEIIYTFGCSFFLYLIFMIKNLGKYIKSHKLRMLFYSSCIAVCMFGTDFNVESICALLGLMYAKFVLCVSNANEITRREK